MIFIQLLTKLQSLFSGEMSVLAKLGNYFVNVKCIFYGALNRKCKFEQENCTARDSRFLQLKPGECHQSPTSCKWEWQPMEKRINNSRAKNFRPPTGNKYILFLSFYTNSSAEYVIYLGKGVVDIFLDLHWKLCAHRLTNCCELWLDDPHYFSESNTCIFHYVLR